jgi:hypothetical protein
MPIPIDRSGVEFLFAELQAGLTFARIASSAKRTSSEKRARNTFNARKAYDSILHFRERVSLSDRETVKLKSGIRELKKALETLGEAL